MQKKFDVVKLINLSPVLVEETAQPVGPTLPKDAPTLFGIPVLVSEIVPADEIWAVTPKVPHAGS